MTESRRWSPEREEALAWRDAEHDYYRAKRDALLAEVDAVERLLDMHPRTAELRDLRKRDILKAGTWAEVTPGRDVGAQTQAERMA